VKSDALLAEQTSLEVVESSALLQLQQGSELADSGKDVICGWVHNAYRATLCREADHVGLAGHKELCALGWDRAQIEGRLKLSDEYKNCAKCKNECVDVQPLEMIGSGEKSSMVAQPVKASNAQVVSPSLGQKDGLHQASQKMSPGQVKSASLGQKKEAHHDSPKVSPGVKSPSLGQKDEVHLASPKASAEQVTSPSLSQKDVLHQESQKMSPGKVKSPVLGQKNEIQKASPGQVESHASLADQKSSEVVESSVLLQAQEGSELADADEDSICGWVHNAYRETLCREPDHIGLSGHKELCAQGWDRAQIEERFKRSDEYKNCAKCKNDCVDVQPLEMIGSGQKAHSVVQPIIKTEQGPGHQSIPPQPVEASVKPPSLGQNDEVHHAMQKASPGQVKPPSLGQKDDVHHATQKASPGQVKSPIVQKDELLHATQKVSPGQVKSPIVQKDELLHASQKVVQVNAPSLGQKKDIHPASHQASPGQVKLPSLGKKDEVHHLSQEVTCDLVDVFRSTLCREPEDADDFDSKSEWLSKQNRSFVQKRLQGRQEYKDCAKCQSQCLDVMPHNMSTSGEAQLFSKTPTPKRHRVLIFTAPKTASTSLQAGFEQLVDIKFFEENATSYPQGARTHRGDVAADFLSKTEEGEVVWVVTAVRHVFARALSGYFQKAETRFTKDGFLQMPMDNMSVDFVDSQNWGFGPHWLTQQYEPTIGVDLMKLEFSPPRLWAQKQWKGRTLNLFVVRFEEIPKWNDVFQQVFSGFSMQSVNVGGDKWYQDTYEKFKATFSPDKVMLEKMSREDELSSFYSTEELDHFSHKFTTKIM